MIDSDLRRLLAQPADRSLDGLSSDIWAGVAARERQSHLYRRLLWLQSAALVAALVGSLVAGAHSSRTASSRPLEAFSPRMHLSISTRLGDARP